MSLCLSGTKCKREELKKKVGVGALPRYRVSHFQKRIFKHGLNQPEMQRNFFVPLGDICGKNLPILSITVGDI